VRFRHDNPHAEKQIRRYQLPRWLSAIERASAEREAERAAKRAAELALVDWGDLSPAELAFRWLLAHPDKFAAWAETRSDPVGITSAPVAWRRDGARGTVPDDAAMAAADWAAMTPAERAYAVWASGKG